MLDSAQGQVPYGKLQYRKLTYDKGGRLIASTTAVWPSPPNVLPAPPPPSQPNVEQRTFWYDGLGRRILRYSPSASLLIAAPGATGGWTTRRPSR